MGKVLLFLHSFFIRHKLVSFVLLIAILSLSVVSITRLTFVEDISRILPKTKNTSKLKFVLKESTLMNKIIFDIHLKNDSVAADTLVKYADLLSEFLEGDSIKMYFRNYQLKVADEQMTELMDVVQNNLPLFLDKEDYSQIQRKLDSNTIRTIVDAGYKSMLSPIGFISSKYFLEDPFGISFIALNKVKSFSLSENFTLYKSRIITKNRVDILLFANLSKDNTAEENRHALDKISVFQETVLAKKMPQVALEVFGGAVVAEENAQRIKKDVAITMVITLVLLMALIAYFFRRRRAIIVIFIPTILGSILALGFLSLFKEEISVISLAIGAVLLGMSVDFSLHVYTHYRENMSFSKLFSQISVPISLSVATTMVAFLALNLVHSEVLNDLGLFAALSIFFSALFALTLLPVLIRSSKKKVKPSPTFLDKIGAYDASKNKKLMLIIVVLTAILYFVGGTVPFDSNMMHSNYMSDKTAQIEKRVNHLVGRTNKELYIISTAKKLDDVLKENQKLNIVLDELQSDGLISNYSTVNKLISSKAEQDSALEMWSRFWTKNYPEAKHYLERDATAIGFKENAFVKFDQLVHKEYSVLTVSDKDLLSNLILSDFLMESDTLNASITVLKVEDPKRVKSLIDERINGQNIWVYNSRLFVANMIDRLNANMKNLVWYSLFFVFMILLLYFGRIELAIITMIPIIFGYIWTIGFMQILDIEFNIFNIIVLSFIFGLGIDYGIFITKGILQKYTHNIDVLKEYKSSILLSFFTTIIGIGALIFAQHPAMRSIALMAIIGILSTLIVTFTIQPLVLNFILYNKGEKREKPVTIVDFVLSILALINFVSGSIFLTIVSFIFRLIPFGTKQKKLLFHRLLKAFSWWMINADIVNKKTVINPNNEDFSKPSVIIANHQSHIDVMMVLQLNPKILILTNEKEWNSKLYGKVLQYADFLPITMPHEQLISELKKRVQWGYSIVVFPEGTRSHDGVLKKFKRGAFLLARELDLDIIPMIIHGTGSRLNKKEFFLRRGNLTTKILDRIDLSSGEYGQTLAKQSKRIFKIYSAEYDKLCREIETTKYYRGKLILSYLYRSPVIEWYMKIKTRMENNYQFFDDLIPRNAKVSDLGCGYGFLVHTLAQTAENREFIGVDFDENKIEVAKNISLVTERTRFVTADLTDYEIEVSDVILITDVLHYISEAQRAIIIRNAYERLNVNGFIVIRDGDQEMEKKHKVTKFSEVLSTFIKFNKADYKDLDFLSRNEIISLVDNIGAKLEIIDNTQFTSNIIYIIRK